MHKNIVSFLKTVCVVDTESTDFITDTVEICEVGGSIFNGKQWGTSSQLFGTLRPIPAQASAKNCISSRMLAGKQTFIEDIEAAFNILGVLDPDIEWWVAHNCEFDRQLIQHVLKQNDIGEMDIWSDTSNWICTWRLAKQLLGIDYDNIQYSQNFLRYYLDLDLDDLTVHRAGDDTKICAALLEKLIELGVERSLIDLDEPIGPQLHHLSWTFAKVLRFPFGKHKGSMITDVPADYLMWAVDNMDKFNPKNEKYDRDLAETVLQELQGR